MDLLEIHPLDVKLISPRELGEKNKAMEAALLEAGADAVDWSHGGFGQGYPWWVFMAGRVQHFAAMLNEGRQTKTDRDRHTEINIYTTYN